MRDLSTPFKTFGAACGALLAACVMTAPAHAANPLEMNFWLSGPKYEGRVAPCEAAIPTIVSRFQDKESTFWNSSLTITGVANVREIAFRPWQSDNIPRRFCTGSVMISDGKARTLNYSIIEDGGFAGYDQGVEFCVVGLDRNWAFNPACRAAKP
ncbi:hypothetical protein SSBR45G_70010 [Bradyrhizobium sp. SSBR45G]|uniref:hypothetical protein n=1 Tax=unclassified Bradyrhizobium TaxID=2631580 RepID=UPI002342AD52|nr:MULTISPECIES: hypothetical protein [unclassified Bradyrhizobium]GLH82092.1 hypothetical protein SSBR45G_70010 [Bradyrhizobium sp. SSBR45G]GLH89524.1 hypothetical protein SSBR45R_69850 [Bradyrhizobium sp. SSBR45R]